MKRSLGVALVLALVVSACTPSTPAPIVVGAVYPISGPQGMGAGRDEYRGVLLAQRMVNDAGGVQGRPLQIRSLDVAGSDAAASAVEDLDRAGVRVVLGSYGSAISRAASTATAAHDMVFWETGAVGMIPESSAKGELTFRVPPTGATLGREAIDFISAQLAPRLRRDPHSLRFAISHVDDVYGRSVAGGAIDELHSLGLKNVGDIGYDFRTADMNAVARRIAAARPDVLFVSAYLADGIALRRALVAQHVRLLANIGTSSSYCEPDFGMTLGKEAVGLFASDKPSGWSINPTGLSTAAADLLERANDEYESEYGNGYMSAPALAGFSGAWALFTKVLPAAAAMTPEAIGAAARAVDLPKGSLPNGSGLRFGAPGTVTSGDNVDAGSVIWQWVAPGKAAIVWPPSLATRPIESMNINPWTSGA
jgi:branched-chain amino acid transport system substrate-binding protein